MPSRYAVRLPGTKHGGWLGMGTDEKEAGRQVWFHGGDCKTALPLSSSSSAKPPKALLTLP